MKKMYQDPVVRLVTFETQDILTASSTTFALDFKDRNTVGNGDSDAWGEI